MPLTVEQLVYDLVETGVVPAAEIDAVRHAAPARSPESAAQDLARELVKRGKLTPLQASAAYAGKARQLVLGQYLVLDKIGAGGMGQVFKAAHKLMRRTVAIKVLPRTALASPEAVERFQREVEAAARLEHPNIVMAFDADEAAGLHFLVMQYIDGKDLATIVKEQGPLAVDAAIDYILQAARGLAYAHQHGVIHRDVKPANLLVDHEGTVKMLDLGLARLTAGSSDAGLTCAGQVLGTVDYMAPEQGADIHQADGRADIYALGCTLFTLLTGRPMYGGSTPVEKLLAHRTQPPPLLRSARPEVPEAVERIYLKMVAKRPEARYQTMDEVIGELGRLRGGAVIPPPLQQSIVATTQAWVPTAAPIGLPGTDRSAAGNASQAATVMMKGATTARVPVTDHLALKVGGTVFATIVAPILVAVALKYSDAMFSGPPGPPAATSQAPAAAAPGQQPPAVSSAPAAPAGNQAMASATPAATSMRANAAVNSVAPAQPPATPAPPKPSIRLFNGFGLAGLEQVVPTAPKGKPGTARPSGTEHVFRAIRGLLHVTGTAKAMLVTQQQFDNYRLTIEYKWGNKIANVEEDPFRDGGVIVHCQGMEPVHRGLWPVGLRCVIGEGHTGDLFSLSHPPTHFNVEAEGEKRSVMTRVGRRFNFFYQPGAPISNFSVGGIRAIGCEMAGGTAEGQRPKQKHELPLGEWNKLELVCAGNTLTVVLNGTTINRATELSFTKGHIALQSINAEWIIRSMMLQPL